MTDLNILTIVVMLVYVIAVIIYTKKLYDDNPIRFESRMGDEGTPEQLRESVIDEVYFRCKALADSGEVNYFSYDDIRSIIDALKKERLGK